MAWSCLEYGWILDPESNGKFSYKRYGGETHKEEAEVGVVWRRVEGCWQHHQLWAAERRLSPEPPRGSGSASISGFWLPELSDNRFTILIHQIWMVVLATRRTIHTTQVKVCLFACYFSFPRVFFPPAGSAPYDIPCCSLGPGIPKNPEGQLPTASQPQVHRLKI